MEELLNKLRYKEGRAIVLGAPDGYRLGIEAGEGLEGKYEFIQLFVNNAEEAEEQVVKAIPFLNEDALFWITYPKQNGKFKPDINRDSLAALVQNITPYRPVSNVAIDDKWSALRFRPKEKVKSSK
jgi:hypothetical protein